MSKLLQLQDVFVLSGIPEHTFVQPVEYSRLLVALRTPGRSIVIEGPSGIGKTTATVKAISESGLSANVLFLSARKPSDLKVISQLPEMQPLGTVLIDDFHRLNDDSKNAIANLMKVLADEGASHSKLVVLGITNAGRSLLAFGRDLANRIEIIPFEANPEYKIAELLKKGGEALNVTINIADEIVAAAQGSFYISQMLAYETCLRSGVLESSHAHRTTKESYESVKAQVMKTLSRSFHDIAVSFARGSKLRREGRAPYLHLLHWLSQSSDWSINTQREIDRHPNQRGSVSQVVTKGFLMDLIQGSEGIQQVLHFDPSSDTMVVQDPQFVFYIRNLSWPQFAREVGFTSLDFPSRYDFALSFAGSDRDIAEAIFKALTDMEMEVFYDRNEQHRILAEDVEEYLAPIYSSDAEIVVCVLGSDYPKRIWTKFESDHIKERFGQGQVVPIVVSGTSFGIFDQSLRVGHFQWDRAKDFDAQSTEVATMLSRKIADRRR